MAAKHVWVNNKVVKAILQVGNAQVSQLKRNGELGCQEGLYNLGDVLERYQRHLRSQGILDQQSEAMCIEAFEQGLLPQEVIIKHGFSWDTVRSAWQNWNEMNRDPEVMRVLAARAASKKKEEAERCLDCARTPTLASEDTLRIVVEVTGDPLRTDFTVAEERAFAGLNLRCPRCRAYKATAPIHQMKGRLHVVRVMGEPKPVELPSILPPVATPPHEVRPVEDTWVTQRVDAPCNVSEFSSRICLRGVTGCDRDHREE